MERSPLRAWLVAITAGAGWLGFLVFHLASRWQLAHLSGKQALAAKVARFALLAGPQALIQLAVFFALPFYWRAAHSVQHSIFVALLGVVGAVTLWDPWYLAVAQKRLWGPLLHGFANFAGLNCVLPMVGLSHRSTWWIAGGLAALGPPFLAWLEQQRSWLNWAATFLIAGALVLLPPLVPPAPLRLVDAGLGTGLAGRELTGRATVLESVPAELWCWTAIEAPRGLQDQLFHVWSHQGRRVEQIPVQVSGGREAGFRTWTRKRSLTPGPGTWTCQVETATGQSLGQAQLRIQ